MGFNRKHFKIQRIIVATSSWSRTHFWRCRVAGSNTDDTEDPPRRPADHYKFINLALECERLKSLNVEGLMNVKSVESLSPSDDFVRKFGEKKCQRDQVYLRQLNDAEN
ncbi:hypothetical protein TNCV_299231 [Trichonephila clavipes]|nr:hypothetical protein TNCV_299231 [Trichonephila clavipes]